MNDFPLTLEAVEKGDKAQWSIGDALRKEIVWVSESESRVGVNDGLGPQFKKCAVMLEDRGFDYSEKTLKRFWTIARAFPKSERRDGVAWGVHAVVGTPENLEKVAKRLRQMKTSLTQPNAEMVMQQWRQQEEDAQAAENAERERRRAAAQKKKAAAKTRKDKEAQKAAEDEIAANQPMPKPRAPTGEPPEPSKLEAAALIMKIDGDAKKMVKTLRTNLEQLDTVLDQVNPEFIESMVNTHEEVATQATLIADRFKKKNKRFTTIPGGAA